MLNQRARSSLTSLYSLFLIAKNIAETIVITIAAIPIVIVPVFVIFEAIEISFDSVMSVISKMASPFSPILPVVSVILPGSFTVTVTLNMSLASYSLSVDSAFVFALKVYVVLKNPESFSIDTVSKIRSFSSVSSTVGVSIVILSNIIYI